LSSNQTLVAVELLLQRDKVLFFLFINAGFIYCSMHHLLVLHSGAPFAVRVLLNVRTGEISFHFPASVAG